MRAAVILVASSAAHVASTVISLDSDSAVTRARDQSKALFIMLQSPFDHGCKLAAPFFRTLHGNWTAGVGPPNVTFAFADSEKTTSLAKTILGEKGFVPGYALYVKGVAPPFLYSGGWSDKSLGAWLHKQLAMRPTDVGSIAALREAVDASSHGLVLAGFLTEAQRGRRLLEIAARAAQSPASVVHGDAALAAALGQAVAAEPCVLVVRRDETRWPLLRKPLAQHVVEAFARERTLPSLIRVGDKKGKGFGMMIRQHPLQLHVCLFHRTGEHGPHEPSDDALEAMRRVAERREGDALYMSYDFFDNDPDAFSTVQVKFSDLPAAIAIYGRGTFHEKIWRMAADKGGEFGALGEDDIEQLVERALGELTSKRSKRAGKLTAGEQQQLLEVSEGVLDGGGMATTRDEL